MDHRLLQTEIPEDRQLLYLLKICFLVNEYSIKYLCFTCKIFNIMVQKLCFLNRYILSQPLCNVIFFFCWLFHNFFTWRNIFLKYNHRYQFSTLYRPQGALTVKTKQKLKCQCIVSEHSHFQVTYMLFRRYTGIFLLNNIHSKHYEPQNSSNSRHRLVTLLTVKYSYFP